MQQEVHREMAFQALSDYPNKDLLTFLLLGVSKPEWGKDEAIKIKWLKEWMDMPDNQRHTSKLKNDHSYKIAKTPTGFEVKFIAKTLDQATVVARLKYAVRDIDEWETEEEPRPCAIALAKSVHWVIDSSTPPHTLADWGTKEHSAIETDFDNTWKDLYKKAAVTYGRKNQIKDVYLWAKSFIEEKYDRNCRLLKIYTSKGSIKKGDGAPLGQEVIQDVLQNLADYFAHIENKIDLKKLIAAFKSQ